MRILIAIDDSSFARAAVESVACRPWLAETEFLVLSVLPPVIEASSGHLPALGKAQEAMHAQAEELVARTVAYIESKLPGHPVEGTVVEGNVRDAIIRTADQWRADLIVLGSHGRTGLTRFLLGSVAESVVSLAPCSVEIIRSQRKDGNDASCDSGVTSYVSF